MTLAAALRWRSGRFLPALIPPLALVLLLHALVAHSRPAGGSVNTVIISEVAWGGTAASSNDEWIELHNTTPFALDLSGWTLQDGDGELEIVLAGSIPAGGFYLLERSDDNTVSDIPADQIYSGSLANGGERLTLANSNGQVVDTANGDGGAWPAGTASPTYASMERGAPQAPDTDANWLSNNGLITNGLDANGQPLRGTPGQPNAAWFASPASTLLINAVLYDGYEANDADEAIQLYNSGDEPLELAGWQVSNGSSVAMLPAGTILAPGGTIWLARDATAFQRQFGFSPLLVLAPWPTLANDGDEVLLLTPWGETADVLVYEGGDMGIDGWSGPAILPYVVTGVFGAEGQILYRRLAQDNGLPVADTDTAADWAQHPADVINGRKVRYPGWDLESLFQTARITQTAVLTVAIAPDHAYTTLVNQIHSAQSSLQIVSLSLENVAIGQALAAAAGRGVAVTILLEGSPAGGLADQERYICQLVETAGGACWFMISDAPAYIADRYRYMHAKYMVIDGTRAVISSENLSPNSLPDDDKSDGTWGRRGVLLVTDVPGVVARLQAIFAADFAPAVHQDLFRWTAGHSVYGAPPAGFVPITVTGGTTYTVRYPQPAVFSGQFAFEVLHSPENSLRDMDSLLGLLARAGEGDTVLVQQLQERPYWGASSSNPVTDPNLRLEAYLAAARRGARVRLLLDSFFDDGGPTSNRATCNYVRHIAAVEGLDLGCMLGNPAGMGIHNKMVLVEIDGRGWIHVGSLNGTEQSAKGNREVALQVQSDGAYAWLAEMFWGDWPRTVYLPLAQDMRGRANYPLISEIYYDPLGLDDAEFIEIANPGRLPVDLSDWQLGDAVQPTDFEDMRRFPAGTMLAPGEVLVVATTAAGFRAQFGYEPDFEILDSDPAVPDLPDDPAWGDPAAFLQLGNSGDEIVLRNPAGVVVDVVTYGEGQYPGVATCELLPAAGYSLERWPYWLDTGDCSKDFRAWPLPTPGFLPG